MVEDPNSVAREFDSQDTDNDKNDFVETTTPTPGEANLITAPIIEEEPPQNIGSGGPTYTPPTKTYNANVLAYNFLDYV